jgi:hypothetical protein
VFTHCEFPLILILTHRRGVGIMVCKDRSIINSLNSVNFNLFQQIKHQKPILTNNEIFEFLDFKNVILSRVIAKTAENLFAIYKETLQKSSLYPSDVKTLIVGIGPGSFTGLRLGCAFVNGMKLASVGMKLLPVSTFLTPKLLKICKENFCEEECIKQLGDYQLEDESTGYITFFDLAACLFHAKDEKRQFVDSLSPEYGKEPGPVLKLREGINL